MNIRYIAASCLTAAFGLVGIGAAAAATVETAALNHEATPGEETTADISVTSADALAGEQLSVLILDDDADLDNPSTGDIVFIEQYVLDETGAIDFSVQLPTAVLEDYDIALNTSAATDRYVASLVGTDEDDQGSDDEDGKDDPDDGATDAPDDGATDEPDDGGTTRPDDGQTPGGEESPGDSQTPGDSDADSGSDDDATGAAGADGSTGDDAQQAGEDQGSDGFLASTGASIAAAVIAGLVAIGLGMLFVMRRRAVGPERQSEL